MLLCIRLWSGLMQLIMTFLLVISYIITEQQNICIACIIIAEAKPARGMR